MEVAALGLSCSTQDLCCIRRDLSAKYVYSLVVVRGLSSSMACGILVHLPGIKPMSPALQGGFLTSGPPGKSQGFFNVKISKANLSIKHDSLLK